jgi:hypothetical protein
VVERNELESEMRAALVVVRNLATVSECLDAIDGIERDPVNTVGGITAFYSGQQTFLTPGAQRKIEAIQRHLEALGGDDEEGM